MYIKTAALICPKIGEQELQDNLLFLRGVLRAGNTRMESLAMAGKKWARRASAHVLLAPQKGCDILTQSLLGGRGFTSWLHPTPPHHINSCFNAISRLSRLFGILPPRDYHMRSQEGKLRGRFQVQPYHFLNPSSWKKAKHNQQTPGFVFLVLASTNKSSHRACRHLEGL